MDEVMLKAVQRLKELIGKEPTTYPEDTLPLAQQVYCVAFACLACADNCANVFCFCSHA